MELRRGQVVAQRYRLDHLLGEGGMGVVWAATHDITHKAVALKFLSAEAAADPQMRQRFLREARAACAVDHPNVVRIHDVIEDDGVPLMVMDLLAGESLGARLDRESKLPLADVALILLPVVSAVGTAHAAGIVHRDLKPDNIFLTRDADDKLHVTVLDFGIAKVTAVEGDSAQTGGLTNTGAMLGTPYYMAPEQVFGEKDIDQRADIWALGVILYECLSGQRPTQADNIGQILKIVTTGKIPPLGDVAPHVPADVVDMVGRMLQRDRDARITSLREVGAVLGRYTDAAARSFGDPIRARTSSPSLPSLSNPDALAATLDAVAGRVTASKLTTLSSTTHDPTIGSRPSRRRAIIIGAGGVAAALAIAAGVYLPKSHPSTIAPTQSIPPMSVAPPIETSPVIPKANASMSAAAAATEAPATTGSHRVVQPDRHVALPKNSSAPSASAPPTNTTPMGAVVERPPF